MSGRTIKKVLITFDLNKTLLYAYKKSKVQHFNDLRLLENIQPSDQVEGYNLYFRNGRPELLNYLFMENSDLYQVGVWSSLDADFTGHFAKSFFGRYYRNLAFVIATNRVEYEGNLKQVSVEPLQIKRNFHQIQDKFPGFEHNNIMMVSNYKNLVDEYTSNDIILNKFDPLIIGNSFTVDFSLQALVKYLRGMRVFVTKKNIEDIRPMMQAKHFSTMIGRVNNTATNYTEYR
ncbi:hypothetical protein TTHERM_00125580 (macronuclear) [Tetrahymena thermophila SB210]|uniref:NLI interacting factor-like phosphatase n=1 Tax=Tetrahymena thermophila (strain SB210) TaxID=312017 RepID=I7LUT2_TETTS|nr:hypothetical protein TTHERM_00125580 [Tetrahymena thermophila SB210]EAR95992.1 hypothetical protein TTHERM_00125580 [Tetrahymena thermophila SB210]|eukprot:XP_001016237.1 hypothetical protein TTHERM_00125580 [Tetrahymena thermophila SB210]